jgi:hypothetical protein
VAKEAMAIRFGNRTSLSIENFLETPFAGKHPKLIKKGTKAAAAEAAVTVAPTEVRCEFLKSRFFVVAVFLSSNRAIIRINMHREATRNLHMVPWGWGEGRFFFNYFPNLLRKKNISIKAPC